MGNTARRFGLLRNPKTFNFCQCCWDSGKKHNKRNFWAEAREQEKTILRCEVEEAQAPYDDDEDYSGEV